MVVLVDTSVWIDYIRKTDDRLTNLLEAGDVVMHPYVAGELMLGNIAGIYEIVADLREMRQAMVATNDDTLNFIVEQKLSGSGIGYVDANLLASVSLTPGALVWTRDKRLQRVAERLSLATDFQD